MALRRLAPFQRAARHSDQHSIATSEEDAGGNQTPQKGDIVYLLCRSEGREEKDRAIRKKQETKLIADLNRLQQRVAKGRLKRENKIQRAIGRLLERYPRVARYYEISYDAVQKNLSWNGLTDKKATAKKLDGS